MKLHATRLLFVSLIASCGIAAAAETPPPAAKPAPVTITQLFKQNNPDQKDRDLIVQRIEIEPASGAPPHVHPGMVTGYVVSGTLEFQIEGGPLLTLKAGETFFEPPGSKHLIGRNPDPVEKTVLIAFVVNPKNTEIALPAGGHK